MNTEVDTLNATRMEESRPLALSCLTTLIFLNLAQVAAGFSGIEVSPPLFVLPLIVSTAAWGIFSVGMTIVNRKMGYYTGIVFALLSIIGMGPHKLFSTDGAIIAPVAILGFGLVLIYLWTAIRCVSK